MIKRIKAEQLNFSVTEPKGRETKGDEEKSWKCKLVLPTKIFKKRFKGNFQSNFKRNLKGNFIRNFNRNFEGNFKKNFKRKFKSNLKTVIEI